MREKHRSVSSPTRDQTHNPGIALTRNRTGNLSYQGKKTNVFNHVDLTIRSNNSTLRYMPKRIENINIYIHAQTCSRSSICNCPKQKQPARPSADEWAHRTQRVYTIDQCSALKRNVVTHAATRTNLENSTAGKGSQSERTSFVPFLYLKCSKKENP